MGSFAEYADWYRASARCAACRGRRRLVNANFGEDGNAVVDGCSIVPQPGFMDRSYFDAGQNGPRRVLLLGINPGAGRQIHESNEDGELYGTWLPRIATARDPAPVLCRVLPNIRRAAKQYNVLRRIWRPLKTAVREVLGATVFGYSNQLLCRTTEPATQIQCDLEVPAGECWRGRLLPLVRIIEPDLIVAMGTTWRPGELQDSLDGAASRGQIRGRMPRVVIDHPSMRPPNTFDLQAALEKVKRAARRLGDQRGAGRRTATAER